jgi:subtilisin family serine protease
VADHARRQGWIVEYQAKDAPVVVAKVPNGQLQALEARGDVEAIYLGRVYREELNVSVPAIDTGTLWARGFTGTGVKVAVVETGGIYFGHSNLADGIYCNTVADSPVADHATGVAGIIASTHSTYKGVAYGAPALLSGNAKSGTDAEVIKCTEWAVDQGAQVINMSFGTNSTSAMAGLDRYVDYVIRNRFVTIIKSAGNKGFTCSSPDFYVTTPGKGWNILTVGNYNDGGTASNSNDVMNMDASGGSCYQDPASTHGDREKPEVAAPGTSITTTFCKSSSTCTGTGTGTSFSAPHVAGCAALLIQRSSTLGVWPEAIRAILMASAVVNLEGDKRLSEHDGTGGIECDSADDIVRGAAGFERHGVYASTDFPMNFTFSTAVGRTVRVVIAWDSTTDELVGTTAPATDVLKADLDLQVLAPDGTYLAGSVSWDNSYEIVEFTAPATGTYTATISAIRFEGTSEFLSFAWWDGIREK